MNVIIAAVLSILFSLAGIVFCVLQIRSLKRMRREVKELQDEINNILYPLN